MFGKEFAFIDSAEYFESGFIRMITATDARRRGRDVLGRSRGGSGLVLISWRRGRRERGSEEVVELSFSVSHMFDWTAF